LYTARGAGGWGAASHNTSAPHSPHGWETRDTWRGGRASGETASGRKVFIRRIGKLGRHSGRWGV